MKIVIETRENGYFNVGIQGSGKDPFLVVRGCKIVDGAKGRFISGPAKKMDSGKWLNHVWFSDAFAVEALKEYDKEASKPAPADDLPPF